MVTLMESDSEYHVYKTLTLTTDISNMHVSSDFRPGVNKTLTLPGCYAAGIVTYLLTFRDNLSVPNSRVKQSSSSWALWLLKWDR
jgi:hypothetical protein